MLTLDHLAVCGTVLDDAAAHLEAALGVVTQPGGAHARFATHNRLLGLGDGLYLEAIAPDAGAPPPPSARWFGLDRFQGPARLSVWVCRVDDLDAALERLPMAGRAVPVQRGDLRWRIAVPDDGQQAFGGVFPALIEWDGVIPGFALPEAGARFTGLEVISPEAEALQALLSPFLDDPCISFTKGPVAGLSARFDTLAGERVLR